MAPKQPPDPDGPHKLPHGDQIRCAVVGNLLTGGVCTVVLIRDQARHCWVLYPHGVPGMGVRLTDDAAQEAAELVLNRGVR